MTNASVISLQRPKSLREVAERSDSLDSFGYNLRDWQHEISRRITSRQELAKRLRPPPRILASKFGEGNIADAYLAAYADWLAQQAKVPTPLWARRKNRSLTTPWYSNSNHSALNKDAPDPFKKRVLFTVPENVFHPKPGRPRVSTETKRHKAIARQHAYRQRMKSLIDQARALGLE